MTSAGRRERYARAMRASVSATGTPTVPYSGDGKDLWDAMAGAALSLADTERARDRATIEGYRQRTDLQHAAITTLREERDRLKRELHAVREENGRLRAEYDSAADDKWAEYDRAQSLLEESTRLSDENERLAGELERAEDATHGLTRRNRELRALVGRAERLMREGTHG